MRNLIFLVSFLLLTSCQELDILGLIIPCQYDAEERFHQSMAYNERLGDLVLELPHDGYHINVAGDIHVVDETARLDSFLFLTRQDSLTACNLFLGDIVSVNEAYPLVYERLQEHYRQGGDTVFTIAGNHELYYNGWPLYLKYFGSSIYTVSLRTPEAQDLIICLESTTSTLGKYQNEWLLHVLKEIRPQYRYCIVATHANFFDTDNSNLFGSNPPVNEVLRLTDLFQTYHVDACLQAHDHRAEYLYFKGVRYVQTNPLKMGAEPHGYLQIKADAEDLKIEIVDRLRPRV